ncbi:Glutamate transport ATP-binding protein [Klebsiella pneumoniae]|nr:Glutamate transport ATP-binding protein [Klebsiella pneumoniae]
MPLITINQMQKYYGDNHVLKGVDLDIDMGEVISIIGRSGSGKSTLLRCINGLEGYQEGSIKLGGMTITNRDSQAREISRSIGMVFQNFNLFPHMTALENVMLAPAAGAEEVPGRMPGAGAADAGEGRARRPSGLLPGQPLRRPTAARGHCPGAGHVAESFTL